jgi:hypothetical protein
MHGVESVVRAGRAASELGASRYDVDLIPTPSSWYLTTDEKTKLPILCAAIEED